MCDNSDPDVAAEIRDLVKRQSGAPVRYVRPPDAPLCMTDNWNYALDQASGDVLTVLGDDDGLMPYCLTTVDKIRRQTGTDVISWAWAFYFWPDYVGSCPNSIHVSALAEAGRAVYRVRRGAHVVSSVVNHFENYFALPMLYNSFVSRGVLEALRRDGKPFLDGQSPDIYSGIAIGCTAPAFVSLDYPLALAGQGGSANGAASVLNREQSPVSRDFTELNSRSGKGELRGVADEGVFAAQVTDSYTRFMERYPEHRKAVRQSRRRLAEWQSSEVAQWPVSAERRERSRQRLLAWFRDDRACLALVERAFAEVTPRKGAAVRSGITHSGAVLPGEMIGVRNVHDASRLLGKMIGEPESFVEATRGYRWRKAVRALVPTEVKERLSNSRVLGPAYRILRRW